LAQDKATVAEVDKHLTKAVTHQTAIVMLDLAATAPLIQAVVVAAVDHIMAAVDRESLS
jgi:homoaconitase/3-isopropylmalate dehydratase large subunit